MTKTISSSTPMRTRAAFTAARVSVLSAVAILMMSAAIPSASAQNGDTTERLERIEREIQAINGQMSGAPNAPTPSPAGAPVSLSAGAPGDSGFQANIEVRLTQIENQMRDITGRLEKQEFDITQLRDQLTKAQADTDMRLGDVEKRAAPVPSPAPQMTAADDMAAQPATPQQPLPTANDGTPIPRALADSIPQPADINAPAPADSPTQKTLGTVGTSPSADAIAANDYESAFSKLKSGNYISAQAGFDAFLKNYPTHPLSPNATYWLAESYYAQKKYDQAARVFAESFKKYPKGPKSADSLLKLGMSLGETGKTQDACVTLKQVKKQFPAGEGAVLRRADQELKRLGCA